MKYIMFECHLKGGDIVQFIPFIFPKNLVHRQVASYIGPMLRLQFETVRAINAGEYDPTSGVTSGRSTTLNLESNVDDGMIIQCYNYTGGIVSR